MERRVEWANIDNPFLISPAINLPYYSHLLNTETGTCRFKYLLLHRKTSLYIVTSNEALKRVFHLAVNTLQFSTIQPITVQYISIYNTILHSIVKDK